MNPERLIVMANDVATFFDNEPNRDRALDGVRTHMNTYWDPSMRRQIRHWVDEGGTGLLPLAEAAVKRLDPAAEAF